MQQIQFCESRLMLFAELVFRPEISGHELQVGGTIGDDVIRVEYNSAGDRLVATINGQSLDFDPLFIKRILVSTGDGNNSVFVASGPTRFASLVGGGGNDTLTSTAGNDSLVGEAGNDVLDGGSGEDLLFGDDGDDQLFGRGANDILVPGTGTDLVDGGAGNNQATYYDRTDDLSLSLDGIANDGTAGENDNLLRIQRVAGGGGDDVIVGNAQDNGLIGWFGADTLRGQGGNDILNDHTAFAAESANDLLDGGSGNDQLDASSGDDTLIGGGGDDGLSGGIDNDSLLGGSGDDFLDQLSEGDGGFGESGADTFGVDDGNATVDGGSGDDSFFVAGEGQPTILGQSGDDTVITSFPSVSLSTLGDDFDASGGTGVDALAINGSFGVIVTLDNLANDGRAEDTARAANIRSDFERLIGSEGNDFFDASAAARGVSMSGDVGADTLIGSAFADTLEGAQHSDSLVGNAGEDILRGGDGNDTLTGGPGLDSFNGGFGNDVFNAADGEADTVNGAQGLGDSADIDELLDMLIRVESTT